MAERKREMKKKDNADGDERYAAWVGFDWGDQEHVWGHCQVEAKSGRLREMTRVG
ncbi:MAG: hypothetical protein ACR2JB_05665 [Bryobacteraceae bacterium]